MSSQHFARAIEVGHQAHRAAAKVSKSLFPGWRQRGFRRHLGRFIVALEQVPQNEAAALSAGDITALITLVNGVVGEAEAFMAERHDSTTAEVEQDRFVVTEIYQLRAIVESLARHVTADPTQVDLGWTMRTQLGNRPKH